MIRNANCLAIMSTLPPCSQGDFAGHGKYTMASKRVGTAALLGRTRCWGLKAPEDAEDVEPGPQSCSGTYAPDHGDGGRVGRPTWGGRTALVISALPFTALGASELLVSSSTKNGARRTPVN